VAGLFRRPGRRRALAPHLRTSVAAYAGTFASVTEELAAGFCAALAASTVPAVFVLGAQSPMPVSAAQQAAALIPSAEVRVIPGAGHLPWHEQPGCVAEALARVRAQVR
jgi:pimeloyl-ACP methyl ester carboxylesterase